MATIQYIHEQGEGEVEFEVKKETSKYYTAVVTCNEDASQFLSSLYPLGREVMFAKSSIQTNEEYMYSDAE